MNWLYLIFDLLKIAVPILVANFIPEQWPQADLITVILYALGVIFGIDSGSKFLKVKIKYLGWDIAKVTIPIIVASYLPEGAPQAETIQIALYSIASLLGIDAGQKTIRTLKSPKE